MPTTFRPYAPDQSLLFPASPRDWLPEGHLAFFIADTVAALDPTAFYAPYEGDGRRNQPFDPQMLVTVLALRVVRRGPSRRAGSPEAGRGRRLSRAGGRQLSGASDDRRVSAPAPDGLRDAVRPGRADRPRSGPAQLGTLAIDGSKVQANASKHKAMSYGRMRDEGRRLRDEIAALTGQAATTDAAEDAVQGPDVRGDELPADAGSDARIDSRRLRRRRARARGPPGRGGSGQGPHAR